MSHNQTFCPKMYDMDRWHVSECIWISLDMYLSVILCIWTSSDMFLDIFEQVYFYIACVSEQMIKNKDILYYMQIRLKMS